MTKEEDTESKEAPPYINAKRNINKKFALPKGEFTASSSLIQRSKQRGSNKEIREGLIFNLFSIFSWV